MYFSHLVIYLLCFLWNIYRCSFKEFTLAKKTQDGKCFIEEGCINAEFHSEDTCTESFIPETISYIVFNFISTKCLQGHVPSGIIWFWIHPSWQLITECWNIKKCELNITLHSGKVLIGILVHLQSTKTPWLFLMDLSEDNLTRNGMRIFICQGKVWHIQSLKSRVPPHFLDKLLFQTKKYLLEFKHFPQKQRSKRSIRNQSLGVFDEILFIPDSYEYRDPIDIFYDNNDDDLSPNVYGVFDDNLSSNLNELVAFGDDFLGDLSPKMSLSPTDRDYSKQRLHQNIGSEEKKTDFREEKTFPFAFIHSLQSDIEKSLQRSLDVLDLPGTDNDIALSVNPTDKDDLEELFPVNQHRKHIEIALPASKHRNTLKDEPKIDEKEFEKVNQRLISAVQDMFNLLSNLDTDKFSKKKDKFSLNILSTSDRPIDVLDDNQDNPDMTLSARTEMLLPEDIVNDELAQNWPDMTLSARTEMLLPEDIVNDELAQNWTDTTLSTRTEMLLPEDIVNDELAQNWHTVKEINASVQDIKATELKLETAEEDLSTSLMGLKDRIQELLHENPPIKQEDLLKQMETIIHEATYSAAKAMVKDVCEESLRHVDAWKEWGQWSTCSSSCGSFGFRLRHRSCKKDFICIGLSFDVESCEDRTPCEGPQWLVWSSWQECSATCGKAIQYKTRACLTGDHSKACKGKFLNFRECSVPPCPDETSLEENPVPQVFKHLQESSSELEHWTPWDAWSTCSATCKQGKQFRERMCMRLREEAKEEDTERTFSCPGSSKEMRVCDTGPCSLPVAIRANLLNVDEGSTAMLTCNYTGDLPVQDIYWITPQGQRIGKFSSSERYLVHDNELVISNVQSFDQGTYLCILVGADGKTAESASNIKVENCENGPCQYGALCEEVLDLRFVDGFHFRCLCQPGYHGRYCQHRSIVMNDLPWLKMLGLLLIFLMLTLIVVSVSMCMYYRIQDKREKSLSYFQPFPHSRRRVSLWHHMKNLAASSKRARTDASIASTTSRDSCMLESLRVRMGSNQSQTLESDGSVCASRGSSAASKDTNISNESLTSDSPCCSSLENYVVSPVEVHTPSLEKESIASSTHHCFTDNPPTELDPGRTNGNSEVIYQDDIMEIVSHPTTTRLEELANDISSFTKEDLTGSPHSRFIDKKDDSLQEKDRYFLPRHSTPKEDLEQFDYENSFPKSWFAYDHRPPVSVGISSAQQARLSRDASHSLKANMTTHCYSTCLANTRDKDKAVHYFIDSSEEFNQSCTNAGSKDWNNHGLSSEDSDDGSSVSNSSEEQGMAPQNLGCTVGNLDNLVTNGEKNRQEDKRDQFTDEACGHDAEQSSSRESNAKNMGPGEESSAEVCAVTSPATRHESALSVPSIPTGRNSRGGPQLPHISAASVIFGKDDLNERFPQNAYHQISHNEAANGARRSTLCQRGYRVSRIHASQQKHLEGGGEGSRTSVRHDQCKSARDVLLRRALENSFVQSTTESCAVRFSQCLPRAGQTSAVSDGQPAGNSQLVSLGRSTKCEPRASFKKEQSVEWKKQRICLPDIGILDNSLSRVHENSYVRELSPGLQKGIHGRPGVVGKREGGRGYNIQASTTGAKKWQFSTAPESHCFESSQTVICKDVTFSPAVPDSAASSSGTSNFVASFWSVDADKHCASTDESSIKKEPSAAKTKKKSSTSQVENTVRNEFVEETCSDSSISLSDSKYSKDSINQNDLLSSPLRSMLKGSRSASQCAAVTDMSMLERRVTFREPKAIKVEHSSRDFNKTGYRPLATEQQLGSRSCQSEGSPTADHQFGGSSQRHVLHVLQPSPPCKNISMKQNSNSPQNTSAHSPHSSVENSYGSSLRSEVSATTLSFGRLPAIHAHCVHHHLNKCDMKDAQEQQLDVDGSPRRRDSQHFPKLSQISNRHFVGKPTCGHEHQQITEESYHRYHGGGWNWKPGTAKKASKHLNVCTRNCQSHLSVNTATTPAKISGTNLQNPAHPGDICWPAGQSPRLPLKEPKVAPQLCGTKSAQLCSTREVPEQSIVVVEPRTPSTHKCKIHQPKSQMFHSVSGSGPLQYNQEPLVVNTDTAIVAVTRSDEASRKVMARSTTPANPEKSTLTEKLNPSRNSASDASGGQQIQGQSPIKFTSLRKCVGTHAKQQAGVMDSSTSKSQPLIRQAQEDPDGLDLMRQTETNANPSGKMSAESFQQLLSHRAPNAFFKPIEKQDKHDEQHTG